jgi:hypothetical protein
MRGRVERGLGLRRAGGGRGVAPKIVDVGLAEIWGRVTATDPPNPTMTIRTEMRTLSKV